jgi:hypothetical protein
MQRTHIFLVPSPPKKMNTTSQHHFARVFRPPGIREEASGCFRLIFFEPWRMAYETAVINAMVCAFCWFAYRSVHHWLVWLPVFPVFVLYLVFAQRMYRQSLVVGARMIQGHLHTGVRDAQDCGRIREVLCIDVSGSDVGEDSSDGTSRIYLTLEGGDGNRLSCYFC